MLSLYLLLLAFFILLNSLSKLEEDRTRVVLESVNEAFDGAVPALTSVENHPAALKELRDAAQLLEDLHKLFDTTIPATRTKIAADGAVMELELSADSLFRPGRVALQPGRDLLIKRLAQALLDQRNRDFYVEIEVLHGIPVEQVEVVAEAGVRSLEIGRMGALVGELERRGLQSEHLSVGIAPGHAGIVLLVIRAFERPADNGADPEAKG